MNLCAEKKKCIHKPFSVTAQAYSIYGIHTVQVFFFVFSLSGSDEILRKKTTESEPCEL